MNRLPQLYVAHAISQPLSDGGPSGQTWLDHYVNVCKFASRIAELRIVPVVPVLLPTITHTQALNIDKQHVSDADGIAVYVDPYNWYGSSTGVKREIMWARRAKKSVLYGDVDDMYEIRHWLQIWKKEHSGRE